jgi:hypothetical protein
VQKDLHFNLFKLLTDAKHGANFNEEVASQPAFDGTLNGLMINCSNADGTDGMWDAIARVDIPRALLIVYGRSECSGGGQPCEAWVNHEGKVIWTNHPNLTADEMTDVRMFIEPNNAEIARFFLTEYWDCLYSD